jgi:hypothetical protein
LTSTPVVLTVLATILAGLSSSEMIRSQYFRSLAAQNQSKANDQWSLFQTKRIRGSAVEMTIDLLLSRAEGGKVDPEAIRQSADELVAELKRLKGELERLAIHPEALTKFRSVVGEQLKEAEKWRERLMKMLASSELANDFRRLHDAQPTPLSLPRLDSDPLVREALEAVRARQTENETAPLMRRLDEHTLNQTIKTAEENIQAAEFANKPTSDRLTRLDHLLQEQAIVARYYRHAAREAGKALSGLPSKEWAKPEQREAALSLLGSAANVKATIDELLIAFTLARHGYTAQRYRQEAVLNEQAAECYEVLVRLNGALSERHRERSKQFFYGMLVAQAGVTIGTFSLTVKRRSPLWALAAMTGLGAVVFGSYVYVYM